MYYGPKTREGAGWEIAVSMGGLHYILVLGYVPETRSFHLRYERSLLSSLFFWWHGFTAGPKLKAAIEQWSSSDASLSSFRFVSQGELVRYQRDRMTTIAEPLR